MAWSKICICSSILSMMTWEELMGMTSTTRYDIWNKDVLETKNYLTSTNGGRHFEPQSNNQASTYEGKYFEPQANNTTSINWGRHFEPQSNNQASTYGGRHCEPQSSNPASINGGRQFKPQDTDPNDPTKFPTLKGVKTLQIPTQQIPTEEDKAPKQQ